MLLKLLSAACGCPGFGEPVFSPGQQRHDRTFAMGRGLDDDVCYYIGKRLEEYSSEGYGFDRIYLVKGWHVRPRSL